MSGSWWDNFSNVAGRYASDAFSQLTYGSVNWGDVEQGLGDIGGFLGALGGDVSGLFGGGVDTSGQPQSGGARLRQPGQQGDLSQLEQLLGGLGSRAGGGAAAPPAGLAAPPAGYTTPDGVFVADSSPEDRYYKLADAVWSKVFGSHPDFVQAKVFHDMGIENTDQLQQVLLQMPSHIKAPDGTPITIGNYEDMLTTGNKFAQKYFGRPIPDSLITDWVAKGLTEPAAIENWFWSHPANDIPKDQYGAAWDAANKWTQQVAGAFRR